jgi:hypothetical protein
VEDRSDDAPHLQQAAVVAAAEAAAAAAAQRTRMMWLLVFLVAVLVFLVVAVVQRGTHQVPVCSVSIQQHSCHRRQLKGHADLCLGIVTVHRVGSRHPLEHEHEHEEAAEIITRHHVTSHDITCLRLASSVGGESSDSSLRIRIAVHARTHRGRSRRLYAAPRRDPTIQYNI